VAWEVEFTDEFEEKNGGTASPKMNKIESPQLFGFWQRMVRHLAVQPSTPFREAGTQT